MLQNPTMVIFQEKKILILITITEKEDKLDDSGVITALQRVIDH